MHQSSSNKEVHTEEEKEEHSPVKKNQKLGQINDLRALQIKKMQQAIQQQRELHCKRMETANAEAQLAILRVQQFKKDAII